MNRRNFLRSMAGGAVAVVAAKLPKPHAFDNHGASSGVCRVCAGIAPDHREFVTASGDLRRLIMPAKFYDYDGMTELPVYYDSPPALQ